MHVRFDYCCLVDFVVVVAADIGPHSSRPSAYCYLQSFERSVRLWSVRTAFDRPFAHSWTSLFLVELFGQEERNKISLMMNKLVKFINLKNAWSNLDLKSRRRTSTTELLTAWTEKTPLRRSCSMQETLRTFLTSCELGWISYGSWKMQKQFETHLSLQFWKSDFQNLKHILEHTSDWHLRSSELSTKKSLILAHQIW